MGTKIIFEAELREIAHSILLEAATARDTQAVMAVAVIGGDRIVCCDEGIVFVDDPYRGIATIAPVGELGSDGTPSIVGVFVRAGERRQGNGYRLLEAAVRRCQERGFTRVHIDVLSKGMLQTVKKLPPELLDLLDVSDQSSLFPF